MNPSQNGSRRTSRDNRITNGTRKWPKTSPQLRTFHSPVRRVIYHCVSSGRFAYQIKKYCEKAIYAQKTTKANSSFPRSWRCSTVIVCRSKPKRRKLKTVKIIAASELKSEPVQK